MPSELQEISKNIEKNGLKWATVYRALRVSHTKI